MDLDRLISEVRQCRRLNEDSFRLVASRVQTVLLNQSTVVELTTPVTICGDIHGQFHDLLRLFSTGGDLGETEYVFLGDYVDRGHHSVETMTYLFLLLCKWSHSLTLLRGNHECRQITQVYGFYDECIQKYGHPGVWRSCCECFDLLPLAALVDGQILCVHGGVSPELPQIDQIRMINREGETPQEGPFCDLMWDDPDDRIETWNVSGRGAGWLFGWRVVSEFHRVNSLTLLCRAHQLVQSGYKFHFQQKHCLTVWSAPNYCYRMQNLAAILKLNDRLEQEFQVFKETDESREIASSLQQKKSAPPFSFFV